MIREVVREAWAESPALFIAAVTAAPVVVFLGWLWIVVMAEILRGLGVRP